MTELKKEFNSNAYKVDKHKEDNKRVNRTLFNITNMKSNQCYGNGLNTDQTKINNTMNSGMKDIIKNITKFNNIVKFGNKKNKIN